MIFAIEVNGKKFTRWESATAEMSIDKNAGIFSFTSSSLSPRFYPVRAGDAVKIFIGKTAIITGYVDEVSESGTRESHYVTVSGRDSTADLIDSSVPPDAKAIEGDLTLIDLCQLVSDGTGARIKISDVTGLENSLGDQLVAGTDGETCINYLMSYARKLQVYLIADGRGGLQIFRPGGEKATTALIHKKSGRNNVMSYTFKNSYQMRFNEYVTSSQDDFGSDENAEYSEEGTARAGRVIDDEIRQGRYHEIKAEESTDDEGCSNRAQEEANLRRARSREYVATVAGIAQADGTAWKIGNIIKVNDDFAGLSGDFLIRSLKHSVDLSSGSRTRITVAPLDAYTARGVETPQNKRKSKFDNNFVNNTSPKISVSR